MSLFGSAVLAEASTVPTYMGKLCWFVRFLQDIKKFDDSLLLFYPYTPKGSVTCQDKAVLYFLLSMHGKKGQPLLDLDVHPLCLIDRSITTRLALVPVLTAPFNNPQKKPVQDSNGRQMLCIGKWKDPDASQGFTSALETVHSVAHGRIGQYMDPCPDCHQRWIDKEPCGCQSHANTPRPHRSGNVCDSTLMKNTIKWIHVRKQHKREGTAHLLPFQVRQIGLHCSSGNDRWEFGIYVLLLLSINLFLRKLEFSSVEERNFNQNMFVMTGEFLVDALHLKVLGKGVRNTTRGLSETYNNWRSLYLWSNHAAPVLDPVRMLLVWLHSIGWKGGSIFFSRDEVEHLPANGIYLTKLEEKDLYGFLKPVYCDVLHRFEKLGAHTCRKTGYLWAALAGMTDIAPLMQAAHHHCPKVANRYILDALSIHNVVELYHNPEENVGQWRSCYSRGGENNVTVALPGARWQRPLPEIVTGFVEQVLGVLPNHPQRHEPQFLFNKAVQWCLL